MVFIFFYLKISIACAAGARGGVELRWALSYLTFQMYMTSDRLKLVKRRCTMDHCDITGNEDSASKTASYHVSFAPRRVVRQLADWLTLR